MMGLKNCKCSTIVVLLIILSAVISSCCAQRSLLLGSLPKDGSALTNAKKIALTYGDRDKALGYVWDSKTIRINAEQVSYRIEYTPTSRSTNIRWPNVLKLMKKQGPSERTLFWDELRNACALSDSEFPYKDKVEIISKKKAEGIAARFLKEIDILALNPS